jgi:hypothetical protein
LETSLRRKTRRGITSLFRKFVRAQGCVVGVDTICGAYVQEHQGEAVWHSGGMYLHCAAEIIEEVWA